MANTMFSHFKFKTAIFGTFLLASVSAHAGFEWVPSQPTSPTTQAPNAAPVIHAQDEHFTPMPLNTADAQEPAAQELVVEAQTPTEPEPVLKTMKISKPSADVEPVEVEPIAITNQEVKPEPVVIMAEDAPASLTEENSFKTTKTGGLKINPFPEVDQRTVAKQKPIAAPITPEAKPQHSDKPALSTQDVVMGFGTDIPLALALQQIAPSGYAFSFGESVNPGVKVSWNGGKPWSDVVQSMLAPLKLTFNVSGNTIAIHHDQTPPAPQANAPAVQAPNDDALIKREAILDPKDAPEEQSEMLVNELVWSASQGDSLKSTLMDWASRGGFDIEWEAVHDFALAENVQVQGELKKALATLSAAGVQEEYGPKMMYIGAKIDQPRPKLIVKDRAPS